MSHTSRYRASWRIDVKVNRLLRVIGFQEEELRYYCSRECIIDLAVEAYYPFLFLEKSLPFHCIALRRQLPYFGTSALLFSFFFFFFVQDSRIPGISLTFKSRENISSFMLSNQFPTISHFQARFCSCTYTCASLLPIQSANSSLSYPTKLKSKTHNCLSHKWHWCPAARRWEAGRRSHRARS